MSEHTPGPWNRFGHLIMTRYSLNHGVIAELRPSLAGYDANAHLIAAAPDLLEVCQAFVAWDENPCGGEADAARLRRMVATAIAKAIGKDAVDE